jgi:hypothetical protein
MGFFSFGFAQGQNDEHLSLYSNRSRLRDKFHLAGGTACCGDVAVAGVVHDHAVGVEAPAEGTDGALHALDPSAGEAVLIALVVEGD